MLEYLQICSFSGVPRSGHCRDFGGFPAPASTILKQIPTQLRKANILPRGCQARGTLLLLAAPEVVYYTNIARACGRDSMSCQGGPWAKIKDMKPQKPAP